MRPLTQPPRPAHCLRYSNHPTHQCIWCWVRTPLRVFEQGRQSFQTDVDAWMGFTVSTDFPADKQ